MGNRELSPKCSLQPCHLYFALRRNKDNIDPNGNIHYTHMCFRAISYDDTDQILLEQKVKLQRGIWRMYRTVNPRDPRKALNLFLHKLIDLTPERTPKIESIWKTCLMQPSCKATNNLLLDIDDATCLNDIEMILEQDQGNILERVATPSGYHIIIQRENFDIRRLQAYCEKSGKVEIKRDALIYQYTIG